MKPGNAKIDFRQGDGPLDAFGDFLATASCGELDPDQMEALSRAPAFGGTVLLAFNPETGWIEPIHPVSRVFGPPSGT